MTCTCTTNGVCVTVGRCECVGTSGVSRQVCDCGTICCTTREVCFYLYETVTEMHRRTVFTAYVAIESLLIDLGFSKINDK